MKIRELVEEEQFYSLVVPYYGAYDHSEIHDFVNDTVMGHLDISELHADPEIQKKLREKMPSTPKTWSVRIEGRGARTSDEIMIEFTGTKKDMERFISNWCDGQTTAYKELWAQVKPVTGISENWFKRKLYKVFGKISTEDIVDGAEFQLYRRGLDINVRGLRVRIKDEKGDSARYVYVYGDGVERDPQDMPLAFSDLYQGDNEEFKERLRKLPRPEPEREPKSNIARFLNDNGATKSEIPKLENIKKGKRCTLSYEQLMENLPS